MGEPVRTRGRGRPAPPLSVALILDWAEAHHARTGRWPNTNSGPVFGAPGETWRLIDLVLRAGRRGLRGGDCLARLLQRCRGVAPDGARRWTAEEDELVWALAPADAAARTGRTPKAVYGRRFVLGVARGGPSAALGAQRPGKSGAVPSGVTFPWRPVRPLG